MNGYYVYITLVCIFIFVLLTASLTWFIVLIGKQQVKILKAGLEDERIKADVMKKLNKNKKRCVYGVLDKIITGVVCLLLSVTGVLAVLTSARGDDLVKGAPVFKVVASTSMCTKYEGNEYLFKNNLDNQLLLFDLIVLHELPAEEDIQLYDIVVYEHINGSLFVHRIVGIEKPNEKHPDEWHFLLQGDANAVADVFPVKYSQLRSIYRNERIANVGSFVFFMQSPAGILCLLLLIFVLIAMPIVDGLFVKLEYERVEGMVARGELEENALDVFEKYRKKLAKKEGKRNEKD